MSAPLPAGIGVATGGLGGNVPPEFLKQSFGLSEAVSQTKYVLLFAWNQTFGPAN